MEGDKYEMESTTPSTTYPTKIDNSGSFHSSNHSSQDGDYDDEGEGYGFDPATADGTATSTGTAAAGGVSKSGEKRNSPSPQQLSSSRIKRPNNDNSSLKLLTRNFCQLIHVSESICKNNKGSVDEETKKQGL